MVNNYDPLDSLYFFMLRESYTKDTEDLIRWLSENHFYHNTRAFDEASSQASIKWKDAILQSLQVMMQSSATWVQNQLNIDSPFMNANQGIILDPNRYPAKLPPIQGGPNFARALQRMSTPLSAALRGFDIAKVEDDPKANAAFKRTLIPNYDPKYDWVQFARQYFRAELPADKTTYQTQQINGLIKMSYQFCSSIKTRFNTISQDCNQIINFINDSSTGSISNQLKMDQQKLQQMQNTATNNRTAGMASTSPGANAGTTNPVRPVNADTSYEYFMEEYFGEAAPGSQIKPATQSANPKPVNTTPNSNPTTPTSASNKTADSLQASKAPQGAPVNAAALAQKKRQVVAEIVRGALAAKLSAATATYFALSQIMKAHVASYGGQMPNQQPQNNPAPATQPQQQQAVPNQVQQ